MNTTNKLKEKIGVTVSILLIARLGIFIPVPGIDHNALQNSFTQNSIINFLNIFSGGGFSIIGLFALGIVPYINSSIVMQLLAKVIPKIENWQRKKEKMVRKKIMQITRYLTLVWAIIQSFGISLWIKPYVFAWSYSFTLNCIITLTTGSMIIMWFSEIITELGLGNGPSLLIFQNIISGIPKNLQNHDLNMYSNQNIISLIIAAIFLITMLVITVLIQESTRKINIVSARQLSKISELNPQSYIPLKLNQGGVMPIVFASAAMTLPLYIYNNSQGSTTNIAIHSFLPGGFFYLPIYCLLIIAFSYFYSSLILNPQDIAKNLKKMGASIPNIRPGLDTEKYLEKILYKLTLLGSIFLFFIALVPSIISNITHVSTLRGLGATSLLILVGVAIDTAKQLQTYIISQQYDNIME
uniref:Protein translocase subunit SecY n=1 Tax=Rhodymenia pseudopalmata TaxID=31502 RepID=A0A1C9C7V7_RHOPU|nr:preprotein translocase subunit SecY [Rhodymenia pseudopalmata]AOM64462.1 preprotein translocase subunit SecY [Rhodymenia pseudopalmata]